ETDTAEGGAEATTFQLPRACQGARAFAASCTCMYVFFEPEKAELNVMARLTVRLFPDPEADDAPASTVHWLFARVPGAPIVAEPTHPLPALVASCTTPVARV